MTSHSMRSLSAIVGTRYAGGSWGRSGGSCQDRRTGAFIAQQSWLTRLRQLGRRSADSNGSRACSQLPQVCDNSAHPQQRLTVG